MKNFEKSSRGHSQGVPKIFRAPIYGAHCTVIFAIAQLSCFVLIVTVANSLVIGTFLRLRFYY